MTIKLVKETEWKGGKLSTGYWIWVDNHCVEVAYNEEEAMAKYENIKSNYKTPSKEIIKEEEI